jgi:hypothetical protein
MEEIDFRQKVVSELKSELVVAGNTRRLRLTHLPTGIVISADVARSDGYGKDSNSLIDKMVEKVRRSN